MCEILINDNGVVGIGAGPDFISVTGTVQDCPQDQIEGNKRLGIRVSCTSADGPFVSGSAEPDASGKWSVTLDMSDQECVCGDDSNETIVFVTVFCGTSDEPCSVSREVRNLPCIECPRISFVPIGKDDVEQTTIRCRDDGTATVSFKVEVVNPLAQAIRLVLDCGSNSISSSGSPVDIPPNTTQDVVFECTYQTPVTPQPAINILSTDNIPLGCPAFVLDLNPVTCCDDPTLAIDDLIAVINGCKATFTVQMSDPDANCTFHWVVDNDNFPNAGPVLEYEFSQPDSYAVAVIATCGGCRVSTSKVIEVERCGNGNGSDDCAWYDVRCWSICGWLGALLAALVTAYIVLIATGAVPDLANSINNLLNSSAITGQTLAELFGPLLTLLALLYLRWCGPCRLGKALAAGAGLGVLAVVILALFGVSLPNWGAAVISAVLLIIGAAVLIEDNCD